MAHLITGIDLGTHAVKFVCIDAGFRKAKVRVAFEQLVEPGLDPIEARQARALAAGLARVPGEMTCHAALGGDRLSVRRLQFPIAEPRKVESAIPFELEGEIVQPLEDVVFDYEFLPRKPGQEKGTSVLAVAATRVDVGAALDVFKGRGVEPRTLYAAPLVYRYVAPTSRKQVPAVVTTEAAEGETLLGLSADDQTAVSVVLPEEGDASDGAQLLIDMGAARTNLVILEDGRPTFSRTVLRGGNHLTESLATSFGATFEQADEARRTRGIVSHVGFVAEDTVAARMGEALRAALAPWLRDIRQMLASYTSLYHQPVKHLSLVGGCAAQRGLIDALAEELELQIAPLELDRGAVQFDTDEVPLGPQFALAEAVAWAAVRGGRQIDLRKGPFVYRASFSIVRQKAWHLAALAAAVVIAVVIDGAMAYARLHQESDKLEAELKTATTELFGRPDTDADSVARLLKRGFREEMPPIPSLTAYDLVNEISRRLPDKEKITLDIQQLDIRPKKIFIKGSIDSVASVDEMVGALKEIKCFEEISKGAITEVSGGKKEFTLNVKSTCP